METEHMHRLGTFVHMAGTTELAVSAACGFEAVGTAQLQKVSVPRLHAL